MKKKFICTVCGYIHEGPLPADFICIQSSDICLWLSFPSLLRTGIGNDREQSCVLSMLPQGKMAEKEMHTRIPEASISCKKGKKGECKFSIS